MKKYFKKLFRYKLKYNLIDVKKDYFDFLIKQEIVSSFETYYGWHHYNTSFILRKTNVPIVLYLKWEGDCVKITDRAYTHRDMDISNEDMIDAVAKYNLIHYDNQSIYTKASNKDELMFAINKMIQCILWIDRKL